MKYIIVITILLSSFIGYSQIKKIKSMEKDKTSLTEKQWRKKLTPKQYFVLREKGTESPGTGKFLFHKEKGIYKCAGCDNELFTDTMKFDSRCGWPSFDKEIEGGKINYIKDLSHGMERIEIICSKCGGHLGHIFNDGPTKTGKRYCVNSASLSFEPEKKQKKTITLGAGCFWCVEAIFKKLKGVLSVESGYSGGFVKKPSYKQVCSGKTGHAEVVNIEYNPEIISLSKLLEIFFTIHNPTTLNQQGVDIGTQYRSAIFYHDEIQKKQAKKIIDSLNKNNVFPNPIVTEVSSFNIFYKAENYHQEYYELNKEKPYCKMVISPKLEKFNKAYKQLIEK